MNEQSTQRSARHLASRRPGKRTAALALGIAATLSLALAAPLSAEGTGTADTTELALTLEETIRLALDNNRTLVSARRRRETDKLSLEVAEDRYRPQARIGASTRTDNHSDSTAELSIGPSLRVPSGGEFRLAWQKPLAGSQTRPGTWTLGFSQPLLRGFGSDVDTAPLRTAQIREQKNRLSYRDTVARTVESVIGAFRNASRAQRAIAISRESLARAKKQLEVNRALIRGGRMAAREIIQTEAEVANRELDLVESENRLSVANAALISILDVDDATRVRPVEQALIVEAVHPEVERSIETALRQRSDHLGALMDVELAEIELRKAKNERLWDLSLDASVSRGGGDEGRDYGVGLGLSIPLGDRSSELGELSARNGLRDAEIGLVELKQSIRIEVRQAVHEVAVGVRRIELARRSRELAEETLEIEQSKLAQGLTSTFRLTSVEDDLVRAQNGELDATIAYLNALTALDRTLGTTLRTWGIDIESLESGGIGSQSGADSPDGRMNSPQAPSAGQDHGPIAGWEPEARGLAIEPSRRVLAAVERVLTDVRAGSGARTLTPSKEGITRGLLLSLREFEHGQSIAHSVVQSTANNAGGALEWRKGEAPHDGGQHSAGSSVEPILEIMTLRSSDFNVARVEQ